MLFSITSLWTPPKCEVVRKLPYIPLEKDIDELIASCGKKLSTILQLLKETGMRIGEALRLDWDDVDSEQRTVTLNNPEKHGNPRMFSISEKLIAMMGRLPRDSGKVFGNSSWRITFNNFNAQRKHSAKKLGNPKVIEDSLPYISPLESDHGVPSDKGHSPCDEIIRTQEYS